MQAASAAGTANARSDDDVDDAGCEAQAYRVRHRVHYIGHEVVPSAWNARPIEAKRKARALSAKRESRAGISNKYMMRFVSKRSL